MIPRAPRRFAALTLLILAFGGCTDSDEGPAPGSPEAFLEANAAKWRAHEKKAFTFEVKEWSLDGTTTYTCPSEGGVVGACTEVRRCCGEDPRVDTVDGYDSPSRMIAEIRSDLSRFKYESARVDDTSFAVERTEVVEGDTLSESMLVSFHPDLGHPRLILWAGPSFPAYREIVRLDFK